MTLGGGITRHSTAVEVQVMDPTCFSAHDSAPSCRQRRTLMRIAPLLLGLLLASPLRGAEPIQHDFILIDEGLAQLLRVNQRDPSQDWIVPAGHPQARDLQLVGGGRVLVGHDAGYTEFDLAT